jgi:hypothetical protein
MGARLARGAILQDNAEKVKGPSNYLSLRVNRASVQRMVVFDAHHDRSRPPTRPPALRIPSGRGHQKSSYILRSS